PPDGKYQAWKFIYVREHKAGPVAWPQRFYPAMTSPHQCRAQVPGQRESHNVDRPKMLGKTQRGPQCRVIMEAELSIQSHAGCHLAVAQLRVAVASIGLAVPRVIAASRFSRND